MVVSLRSRRRRWRGSWLVSSGSVSVGNNSRLRALSPRLGDLTPIGRAGYGSATPFSTNRSQVPQSAPGLGVAWHRWLGDASEDEEGDDHCDGDGSNGGAVGDDEAEGWGEAVDGEPPDEGAENGGGSGGED